MRYTISLVLFLTVPGAYIYWFSVHGLIGVWRRLGLSATAAIHFIILLGAAGMVLQWRGPLLAVQFGTNWVLVSVGILILVVSAALRIQISKQLSAATLVGVPEIDSANSRSKILTAGIYSRIRHPRYVEIFLALVGCALIANFLAMYALVVISAPALYAVVLLEERELRTRFGTDYACYAARVPRFWPALNRRVEKK